MGQTLALIHTSPTLTPIFGSLCAKELPGIAIFHMVDESLIKDTIREGSLQRVTIRRLLSMIESAQTAGADAVMVTCSSIGEGVKLAQKLFDIPVIRVDEAMAETAVRTGNKIGVLATLRTTLEPTTALLREKAEETGRRIELAESLCDEAFEAVLSGDTEKHDRIVSAALLDLTSKVDVIVLAQASMARVVASMPPQSIQVPILASPEISVKQAKEVLRLQGAVA